MRLSFRAFLCVLLLYIHLLEEGIQRYSYTAILAQATLFTMLYFFYEFFLLVFVVFLLILALVFLLILTYSHSFEKGIGMDKINERYADRGW